ncbi:hypothetical protein EON81_28585, partial [bacterium]
MRSAFASFMLCLLAAGAWSQTTAAPPLESLDVKVLNARFIALGTLKEFTAGVTLGAHRASLTISETLKGKPVKSLEGEISASQPQLEEWMALSTRLLIFRDEDDKPSEPMNLERPGLAVITADYKPLSDPVEILRYVKNVIRRWPEGKAPSVRLRLPPEGVALSWGSVGLLVPADERLEAYAVAEIRSKDPQRRTVGIDALRPFKSKANIDRLRLLLKDPTFTIVQAPEEYRGVELREYPVRERAYDVLREWKVEVPKLVLREEISRIATVKSLSLGVVGKGTDLGWLEKARNLRGLEMNAFEGLTTQQLEAVLRLKGLIRLAIPYAGIDDTRL